MSKQAVRCYIRAYRSICEIAYQASRAYKPPQEIDNELNIFYMKKLSMISSITQILKSLKEMPELKNYALILSKHVKNISEACEIYDLMIEETKDLSTKIEIIGDYADYCLEWGRYEKATTLLQRKLGLEKNSFENYMITIKKLTAVALQQKQSLERYH
jgi:tetratricopeptide (TPR) repeat protein